MRLAIGGPTRDTGPVSFAVDVAELYAKTRERGPWSTVFLGYKASTYIHVGREKWLQDVIAAGFTHALWLDSDMSFPPETAIALALHDQPFVACNYVTRDGRDIYTARRNSLPVPTFQESTGLQAVDGVGFGVVLMRTELVRDLPRPWFRHGLNDAGEDIGEDLMFCRALRAAGHTLYIDHDLSKRVQHVGLHSYPLPCAAEIPV